MFTSLWCRSSRIWIVSHQLERVPTLLPRPHLPRGSQLSGVPHRGCPRCRSSSNMFSIRSQCHNNRDIARCPSSSSSSNSRGGRHPWVWCLRITSSLAGVGLLCPISTPTTSINTLPPHTSTPVLTRTQLTPNAIPRSTSSSVALPPQSWRPLTTSCTPSNNRR